MADRYGDRDSERYGGRERGEDDDRRERYRQGLDYRGPYDVISRRARGGYAQGRDYGEDDYGRRDYGGDYERGYGRDEERGYGRDYERGYARGYGREDDDRDEPRHARGRYYGGPSYGRGYEGGYGGDYERYEGRGYGRGEDYEEDERDQRRAEYGREEERGRGRGAQTDYGRTSSRFFGRGGGGYETRYDRGYDYEDEERGRRRDDDDDDDERGRGRSDRGWLDRAADEVASWFGDREAVRRRRLDEARARRQGRGPKNYRRSDERIREDINDRLSDQDYLDASEIEVAVSGGEVTLNGTVETRYDKRLAEDLAESVSGVTHVQNNLRVVYRGGGDESRTDETTVVAVRSAATAGASNDPTFNTGAGVIHDVNADTIPGVTNETTMPGTTATGTTTTGVAGDAAPGTTDTGGPTSGGAGGR